MITHGTRRRLGIKPVKTYNRCPIAAPFLEARIMEDAALPSARRPLIGPAHWLSTDPILISVSWLKKQEESLADAS